MKVENEQTILDEFFRMREEDLRKKSQEDTRCLQTILKDVKVKEMKEQIRQLPKEYETIKENLIQKLEDFTLNNQIKMAYYNKKYYKQGFEDAVQIERNCKDVK